MENYLIEVKGVNLPKTKLGQKKMDSLILAAEKLFTEVGFFNTSVSDICKSARTAVGTFYIYFESKTDLYRYLVARYGNDIRSRLNENVSRYKTRNEKEREGIKTFIKYAVANPNVYNIIWGSLAVEKQMFVDYYTTFATSYARSLRRDENELVENIDVTSLAYLLMGVTNFIGLRAMFENMTDELIDQLIDNSVMPILSKGMFR